MIKTEQKIPVFDKVTDIGNFMHNLRRNLKNSVRTLVLIFFFFHFSHQLCMKNIRKKFHHRKIIF